MGTSSTLRELPPSDLTGYSFPRSVRLLTPQHFNGVLSRADNRAKSGVLQAVWRRNDLARPRLGLIIAKRHLPLAVSRNRVKRLVRDTFRRRRPELAAIDLVVRMVGRPQRPISGADVASLFAKLPVAAADDR